MEDLSKLIDRLEKLVERAERALSSTPVATDDLPAYERPPLPVERVKHFDGKTPNSDGSIWAIERDSVRNGITIKGGPVRIAYGCISPKKNPELWAHARKVLAPGYFDEWNAAWVKNPFGIYKADVSALLAQGTEVNTILFSYLLGQPFTTYVE